MSQGSNEREHPRDVQCQHCGRFYRNDGIHAHEKNCPYDAVDETIVPLADNGDRDATPSDRGQDPTPAQDSEGMGGNPPADTATDRGPQSPPTPDVDTGDDDVQDDSNDVEELPDRYVPVEDYIDVVEDRAGDAIDVDALRRRLSEYDVVDVQQTTSETIAAFEREEVPL